jgi:integrase
MSKTLIGLAEYFETKELKQERAPTLPDASRLATLRRLAAALPSIAADHTPKNKQLLLELKSKRFQEALIFLPDDLLRGVLRNLANARLSFVDAQVAIAVDILLSVPLRAQNLISLHWGQHFKEPDGPKGPLTLYIPAEETKSKKREIIAELPGEVARRLRWYRREILPRMEADPNGHLFVTGGGRLKTQDTLSDQIIATIAERVGIHMTPHQFRHFGATSYLAAKPDDFETVRQLLGHSSSKTTRIYAGISSERAMTAYHDVLLQKRAALRLRRSRKGGRR